MSEDLSIPKTNSSFILRGIKDTHFENRPIPTECAPGDVIVAPKATGLCGSDTHYLLHGRIGDFVCKDPMCLGHESAGVVVKIGSAVKSLKEGDRVAMEPGESCRVCESCKTGHYNRCPDMIFAGATFFRKRSPWRRLEPLSVAVMAVSKIGQMKQNSNVLVFGAGPVGLLVMSVAKALGARTVIAVDILESRLQFAKEFAATDYHLPGKMLEGEERIAYSRRQADEIRERFGFGERGSTGIDLVVDCTGAEICIQTGLFAAKHGGTFVQVGMGADNVTVPITQILAKELTVKGSFRYGPGCYELALDLVARGLVSTAKLITHRYAFKDAELAFKANQDGKGSDGKPCVKIVIAGPL
ncbi:hypothetical protein RQP46_004889 [Phenoliferia psychrophenolica]